MLSPSDSPPRVSPSGSLEKVDQTTEPSDNDARNVLQTEGLQRRLGNRQTQLVALGGSIGTALFVSIGEALYKAGPGNLFLAYLVHNIMVALVTNCMAEMCIYQPVSGGFIRVAGKWVDDAFGFMAGWNFFFYQVLVIPFEITALSLVLSYWSDNIPVAAICAGCIVLYALLNVFAVGVYGEAEFFLSGGKVVLLLILLSFTFVTMCGGNPQLDHYGFRYWYAPGAFTEYITTGNLGRFEGFLVALWSAAFTCVGPEYVSMIAAEAQHPRTYVKTAYQSVYWRILVFFIGGALACGIVVPYNDPVLESLYSGSGGNSGSAAASPYIIAMGNLGIEVLPHIVTALLATTIFSAGNTYTYCATRNLYGMAIEGRAPAFLKKCTAKGVPIYSFAVVMVFPFLSFLQLSNSSAQVLTWLINLATATTVIDYVVICITYINFYRGCKAQGFDRSKLPYTGMFQPYGAYISLVWMILIAGSYGYASFMPFNVRDFFINYTMVFLSPIFYFVWKFTHKTKLLRPAELDLVWAAPMITAYEEGTTEGPVGFIRDVLGMFHSKKSKQRQDNV